MRTLKFSNKDAELLLMLAERELKLVGLQTDWKFLMEKLVKELKKEPK